MQRSILSTEHGCVLKKLEFSAVVRHGHCGLLLIHTPNNRKKKNSAVWLMVRYVNTAYTDFKSGVLIWPRRVLRVDHDVMHTTVVFWNTLHIGVGIAVQDNANLSGLA